MNSKEQKFFDSLQLVQIIEKLQELNAFKSCDKIFTVEKSLHRLKVEQEDLGVVFLCTHDLYQTIERDKIDYELSFQQGISFPLIDVHVLRKGRWMIDIFKNRKNKNFEDLPSEYW